jgi:hypothetical protein
MGAATLVSTVIFMVPLVWDNAIALYLGTGWCDQQVPHSKDDRTAPIPTSTRELSMNEIIGSMVKPYVDSGPFCRFRKSAFTKGPWYLSPR